jgi:hypothetical protein
MPPPELRPPDPLGERARRVDCSRPAGQLVAATLFEVCHTTVPGASAPKPFVVQELPFIDHFCHFAA